MDQVPSHTAGDARRSLARRLACGSLLSLSAAVLVAVVSCAPSGASGPGVATVGGGSSGTSPSGTTGGSGSTAGGKPNRSSALKYSECMRAHGVTDFPDPNATGSLQIKAGSGTDLNPNSPTFKAAQQACAKYQPGGQLTPAEKAESEKAELKLAECMRAHGITDFPDPSATGTIQIKATSNSDLNPNSPTFKKAQSACHTTGSKAPVRIQTQIGGPPPGGTAGQGSASLGSGSSGK